MAAIREFTGASLKKNDGMCSLRLQTIAWCVE